MYGNPNAKTYFKVPVEWTVYDTVEIAANSLEEAIQFVLKNQDTIPLGTEPQYIDGSYKISGTDDYGENVEKLSEYIKQYYDADSNNLTEFDSVSEL